MGTLTARAKALCLLLALLGGGFAFPLYDAVVYHSRVPANSPRSPRVRSTCHVPDHAVTAQSHSATCALGLVTIAGRGAPAVAAGAVLALLRTEFHPLPPAAVTPELVRFSTTRSRAPPVITA
jgi:hypothetical protein